MIQEKNQEHELTGKEVARKIAELGERATARERRGDGIKQRREGERFKAERKEMKQYRTMS